jgi:hypothetical protein
MSNNLEKSLRDRYGIDIGFDTQHCRDVVTDDADFQYAEGLVALQEELERLFTITPQGSFVDDPEYGLNTDWIGTSPNPEVATTLARVEIQRALEHPSFASRMQLRGLEVAWDSTQPNVLTANGVIECFGFEGVDLFSFGPYALQYLLN